MSMGTELDYLLEDRGMATRERAAKLDGRGQAAILVKDTGRAGGIISREHMDTPVTYESLQALGSIMGSGRMLVAEQLLHTKYKARKAYLR